MTPWRCLFWVQSLLGSGHLRRALLVAEACAAQGAAVTLVNGGPPGPWPAAAGVDIVQMPPLVADGVDFRALVDPTGGSVCLRCGPSGEDASWSLLATTKPDVLVTEMFPFGRRAFRDELVPLLDAARAGASSVVVAASVRDVLVSKPDLLRYAWMAELCRRYYDVVLVHGDERLLPFAASFPLAGELDGMVLHTGFVHPKVTLLASLESFRRSSSARAAVPSATAFCRRHSRPDRSPACGTSPGC